MKSFDNAESHKTQICGTWHFRKELSILDPWYWKTSWCNKPWSYDQRRKSNIPAGSHKSIDFHSPSLPYEGLKNEYLTVKDPFTLWSNLKERYDHQKTVILPKARYDWMHLSCKILKLLVNTTAHFWKSALN